MNGGGLNKDSIKSEMEQIGAQIRRLRRMDAEFGSQGRGEVGDTASYR